MLRQHRQSPWLLLACVAVVFSDLFVGHRIASWSHFSSFFVVEALARPHQPFMTSPQSQGPTKSPLVGCINLAVSVDGFIADKNGSVDWLNDQPTVEGEDFGFGDFLKGVDLMIMGRNTFDVVVGFGKEMWAYGNLPIIVYTRNVDNVKIPDWMLEKAVTVRSASSPLVLWKELEEEGMSGRVYVDGGRTIQTILRAGLIHHISLSRIPILLGEGIPLFDGNDPTRRLLKHVSTKAYPNGTVTTIYQVLDIGYNAQEICLNEL